MSKTKLASLSSELAMALTLLTENTLGEVHQVSLAIQNGCAKALIEIGKPAVPALIETLGDKHIQTCHSVSELLKPIRTPETMRAVETHDQRENHKSN